VGSSIRIAGAVLIAVLALPFSGQVALAESDAVHQAWAVTCAEGTSLKVSMRSTERLPEASGAVRVERRGGTTAIEVDLDSMKPASLFGGDYNTYVLWVVPPSGPAENAGEIFLDGNRGRLSASTPAHTFALLVSAEPHYLVQAPSAFVVLESNPGGEGPAIEQPLVQGIYNFSRSTLDDVKKAKGEVHTEVRQAFTAVQLAKRAGAVTLAGGELAEAEEALDHTLNLWHERKDRTQIAAQARETVRLAVAAQRLAQGRALQASRVEVEGSGGGSGETEERDLRGISQRR
jgi:hypothetical protein